MNFVPLCLFANIFNLFKFSNTVPVDICFYKLNTSDCELPPTPVFTYYTPGSRCEIELWRGCPTFNKFDNEFECSHVCIGRLNPSFSAEDNEIGYMEDSEQCKVPINLDDCGEEEKEVYTFNNDNGKCEEVQWKGCETENKFDDKDACKDACKHLMKDDKSDSGDEGEETADGEKTGEEEKTGDEKTGDEKTGSDDKTEEKDSSDKKDDKTAEDGTKEEKKDDENTEKLKNEDDEDEGDPEETSSVRRSNANQTLTNA